MTTSRSMARRARRCEPEELSKKRRRIPGTEDTNDTHRSKTDPEAKLYHKRNGQEAKLSYLGHVLIENRNEMIADALLTQADGTAEREAAVILAYQ